MVVINIKIRTLEGVDSLVAVDDEALLSEFRDRVEQATSVEKEQQRLIFRGKPLVDDALTLKYYGLEDEMTVHLVKRRAAGESVPSASEAEPNLQQQQPTFDEQHHHSHLHSHSMIVGSVPVERSQLFSDQERTLTTIQELLDRVRGSFDVLSEASLLANQPNADDFTLSVTLRGQREPMVDSPARERFDQLKKELKKLAWMVATVKVLFNRQVDGLLVEDLENQPDDDQACGILASVLQGMYSLDYFAMDELRALQPADGEEPLIELLDELEGWQLPEDGEHQQAMENNITMRHITAADLTRLLERLSVIEASIQEHLMQRYTRVLTLPHSFETSSYPARLLNCFTTAVSRIQHRRAHIYHIVSDFGVHVDVNPLNRIFPQYILYERDEPPEAQISFVFCHPRNSNPANRTAAQGIRPPPVWNQGVNQQPNATAMPSINPLNGSAFVGLPFGPNQQMVPAGGIPTPMPFRMPQPNNNNPMLTVHNQQITVQLGEGGQPRGFPAGPFGVRGPFPPPAQPQATFRIPRPVSAQNPVSFQVGSGPQAAPRPTQAGIRISFQSQAPSSSQEPMDTSGSQPGSPPTRPAPPPQPQPAFHSNSLGQALSEFMNMASQMGASGPVNIRTTMGQPQSSQNRSHPSLVNNSASTAPRRSNSTSRLATGAQRDQPRGNRVGAEQARQAPYRLLPQPNGHRVGGGDAVVGWRQWPAHVGFLQDNFTVNPASPYTYPFQSPYSIFIGQRPPSTIPLYTADPYLPCASRRLRSFELDARHNDFWNDPFTVASGRRLRERPATEAGAQDAGSSTSANNNNSSSNSNGQRSNLSQVRVNNNGEAVFTEEEVFRDYVLSIFEQVASSMADASQSRQPESTQVFGYSPAMWPQMLFPGGGPNFPSEIVGVFSATAEIPVSQPNAAPTGSPPAPFHNDIDEPD